MSCRQPRATNIISSTTSRGPPPSLYCPVSYRTGPKTFWGPRTSTPDLIESSLVAVARCSLLVMANRLTCSIRYNTSHLVFQSTRHTTRFQSLPEIHTLLWLKYKAENNIEWVVLPWTTRTMSSWQLFLVMSRPSAKERERENKNT